MCAEHDGEWKIDRKVFAEVYGWDPGTEASDGEYYFDDFDELPHEKQEEIESLALLGSKVRNFMNLPDEVVKKAGLDPDEVSAENIGDFLTVLNDKLKWPFARIAERFSQSGL